MQHPTTGSTPLSASRLCPKRVPWTEAFHTSLTRSHLRRESKIASPRECSPYGIVLLRGSLLDSRSLLRLHADSPLHAPSSSSYVPSNNYVTSKSGPSRRNTSSRPPPRSSRVFVRDTFEKQHARRPGERPTYRVFQQACRALTASMYIPRGAYSVGIRSSMPHCLTDRIGLSGKPSIVWPSPFDSQERRAQSSWGAKKPARSAISRALRVHNCRAAANR